MKPTKSPQAGTNCRPIGMIPEPDRGFRKHVAQRFRLRCLSGFFGAGDTWPSCNVVHPGCDVEKTLQGAYASGDTRVSDSYTSTWRGRAEVITLWCCYLDSVVHHPQYSQKIPAWSCVDARAAPETPSRNPALCCPATRRRHCCARCAPPTTNATYFQSDRFWFLQPTNPGIICCVRSGCNAVETLQHLFFDCTLARQLWSKLQPAWMCFFELRATWNCIATAHMPPVRPECDTAFHLVGSQPMPL
ncbi:hypothetical protein Plhal304r1_c019g0070091 [Plasmopara halstedii]